MQKESADRAREEAEKVAEEERAGRPRQGEFGTRYCPG